MPQETTVSRVRKIHSKDHLYRLFNERKFVTLESNNGSLKVQTKSSVTIVAIHLPGLRNVESPLKLEVDVVVIINKLGGSVVVTTSNQARGSLFLVD